jgi:hypothetical protein
MLSEFSIPEQHKVWVFVASKALSEVQQNTIKIKGAEFLSTWNAHGAAVKGDIGVLVNQVVLVSADQSYTQNSGCSIDKLTHFIKYIEQALSIDLLNRMYVPFKTKDDWKVEHVTKLKQLQLNKSETHVMNVAVSDSDTFNTMFVQKAEESWVAGYM